MAKSKFKKFYTLNMKKQTIILRKKIVDDNMKKVLLLENKMFVCVYHNVF